MAAKLSNMSRNNVLLIIILANILWCNNAIHSQKRCYTYDAAGCRILRDLSCDPSCTTLVVNTNDSGSGSLRKAIECAENGDTIFFAPSVIGQVIMLTTGPIHINKDIHIVQAASTEVQVASGTRVLQVNSGLTELKHVKLIAGCQAYTLGTAIKNYGDMLLDQVTVVESSGTNCGAASIHNLGNMTIKTDTKIIKQ